MEGGKDINPNGNNVFLQGLGIRVNDLALGIGTGLTGVLVKETLCNNKKHIPSGLMGNALDGLGFVANRGKVTCD